MKVLLVEPDYKNKYPPIGLMKISTYHRNRGDEVYFYKGIMSSKDFNDYGINRVYITSLFTFDIQKVITTIRAYKKLISDENIFIGGIMVTLMKEKVLNEIGENIHILSGLLEDSYCLGLNDHINIDELPLDYSILDQVDYVYPAGDNYFSYTSRGCSNKCKFCAVPILEPTLKFTNNIVRQIRCIENTYGVKRDLLLLDNNILSFDNSTLESLINDLNELGFDKETKFYKELPFRTYLRQLQSDRYPKIIKDKILSRLITYLEDSQTIKKTKIYEEEYLRIIQEIKSNENQYATILANATRLDEILSRYFHRVGSRRRVDFNQGIDARQLSEDKMKILSRIPIEPFRLAFDNIKYTNIYTKAMRLASKYGVHKFSNYILYNFDDTPADLYERLEINIKLAKELGINVFSFPMKYAPIDRTDRKYIGKHWNKHFLTNVYAILNVTKGIVSGREDFFYRAFGKNIDEFIRILHMPKDFVIYRTHFEDNGLTDQWLECFNKLTSDEKNELMIAVSTNSDNISDSLKDIYKFYKIRKER